MSLQDTLDGQTALVTGASRGSAWRSPSAWAAWALASRFAREMCNVLEQTASAMRSEQIAVLPVPADVARSEDVTRLVSQVERTLGPIDIAVNNAGIGLFGPGHEASEQNWDSVLDTNLKAVFLICRAVVPGMMKHGGGHIINISSLAGKNAFAGGAVYCASKWGLQGFSFCLAEDLRASNIRVSVVCPGMC